MALQRDPVREARAPRVLVDAPGVHELLFQMFFNPRRPAPAINHRVNKNLRTRNLVKNRERESLRKRTMIIPIRDAMHAAMNS